MDDRLTHFDASGNAVMVDVSEKAVTTRIAEARGSIKVNQKFRNRKVFFRPSKV